MRRWRPTVRLDESSIHEIVTRVTRALRAEGATMHASLAQVKERLATLKAEVNEQTDVAQSAVTLLHGLGAMVASLRQQLADAIAAGADPAEMQKIVDEMASLETQLDGSGLDQAVIANTPSA